MNEIIKNLYLTDFERATNFQILTEHKVNLVINCTRECIHKKKCENVDYIKIDIDDDPSYDIFSHFDKITDTIHQYLNNNKVVLVHCKYGKSRSVSMIIAYLIKYKNMNFENSLDLVKQKRKSACPNSGFVQQLNKFSEKYQLPT
ncbi:dual specificity phosphatase [Catovirus CTV1]|uniref:protein-serine/threonine phosphatase n=1 Tax=Catovirus CTV1 TaxID=1977631 RepID=A0A1V0S9L9_9VIRU|nr:dual specificity phosphatase [Catovirus CTV1]